MKSWRSVIGFITALTAVGFLLAWVTGGYAQTGTAKTKSALNAEIASCFPDQITGAITPAIMRQCTLDFVASWQQYTGTNNQPGTAYTIQPSDTGQMVVFTSNTAVAVTLPNAGASGYYPFNTWITVNGLGTVTITPSIGTINGQPNLVLTTNQSAFIVSNGTNWQTISFSGGTAINIVGGPAGALGYYATTGTQISPLTQCTSGVYGTNGSGNSQCTTTLPPALTYPSPVFTGTVTGPNSGTWGATGLNGVPIGISIASNAVFSNLGFTVLSPTSLASSTITITGLTANNSPNANNDYMLYYSASDGFIRKGTVGSLGSAGSAGVTALNGLTGGLSLTGSGGLTISPATPNIILTIPAQPMGRLTLTSGTPVMIASQSNASTIYYDCYRGGRTVPVYNGSVDVNLTIGSCEISTALQSSSTGVINSAAVFDVWAVNSSSTLTLCVATNGSGGGWSSDSGGSNTNRGTGYSQLDTTTRPYITNANALATCYNGASNLGSIAANRATYLGTFFSTAAGQTSWTFGVTGAPPTAGCLCIWNAYNRVLAGTLFGDSRASWTYGSTTIREADGSNNAGAFRVNFVTGLPSDTLEATYTSWTSSSSGGLGIVGVGLNTTAVFTQTGSYAATGGIGGMVGPARAQFNVSGANFVSALEAVNSGASTQTFGGSATTPTVPTRSFLELKGSW